MLSVARQKWATGDQMGAMELQEEWASEHPDDLAASMALVKSYVQQNDVESAMSIPLKALSKRIFY